ncbi:MAG: hypothetical protein ACKVT1_19425 [Dehalococcoidia bacterium]
MTSENGAATGSTVYFDAAIAGKRVAADGGSEAVEGQHGGKFAVASREMFEGRLTGRRMDDGDPPWRWLEIGDLAEKPEGFEDATVWCEESYIYALDR